jgi:hypothetical protein
MEQLLIVLVSATIRDDLIDALIVYQDISGFSMQEISGYSREHSQYSLSEQVSGYRKLYRFEVLHEQGREAELLRRVDETCSASHARYWVVPVSKTGILGGPPS